MSRRCSLVHCFHSLVDSLERMAINKKPFGPQGTEGKRAEGVGGFACSDALVEYEDSGHGPTVLPAAVRCQLASTDRAVSRCSFAP